MPRSQIKNERKYEALRREGESKEKAARIANAGKAASKKGGRSRPYEERTRQELIQKAREIGIGGSVSKMKKQELIDTLRHH